MNICFVTYEYPPHILGGAGTYANILKKLEKWGVNIITLMDSAGTMLPEDVQKYINFGKLHSEVKLGFHAHNNLQLGIANVITAIKAASVIMYGLSYAVQAVSRAINWLIDRINSLIGFINKVPFINIGEIGHIGEAEIPAKRGEILVQ